jgi:hypothetical protein
MPKTVRVDDELLRQARAASGSRTDADTVRQGLEALIRHAAYVRLQSLCGSERDALEAPRRRSKPSPRRRAQ